MKPLDCLTQFSADAGIILAIILIPLIAIPGFTLIKHLDRTTWNSDLQCGIACLATIVLVVIAAFVCSSVSDASKLTGQYQVLEKQRSILLPIESAETIQYSDFRAISAYEDAVTELATGRTNLDWLSSMLTMPDVDAIQDLHLDFILIVPTSTTEPG